MTMFEDFLVSSIYGLGLMGLSGISYGVIHRNVGNPTVRSLAIGLAFSMTAILAMMHPIDLSEGVILDARAVIVGLASAFGGIPAAVVSGLCVAVFRLHVGGVGAIAGASGIVACAALGLAWRRFTIGRVAVAHWQLLGLGALLSLHSLTMFILPMPIALSLLTTIVPALSVSSTIGALVMGTLINRERNYIKTENHWRHTAATDSLTGLPNRRSFMSDLKVITSAMPPEQYGMILIVDIDYFKKVNDTFGHDAGDMVLKRVAKVLRETSHGEFVCRLGGEEFAIFSPDVHLNEIYDRADEYRAAIERQLIRYGNRVISLTVSIGAASWLGKRNTDMDGVLREADIALYIAKANGRNRVVLGEFPAPTVNTAS